MAINVSVFFLILSSLFFNIFPFPFSKAWLIGDWHEIRRGAPCYSVFFPCFKCFHLLLEHRMVPDLSFSVQNPNIFVHFANTIGAGCIIAPILLVQGASARQYYWRRVHRCTNTIGAGCIGEPIIF